MDWEDYDAIGVALAETFPNANHLTISEGDLVRLVLSLPGFTGGTEPDRRALAAVSYAWIAAVEGPDDSSPYESKA
ncbi:MAG TPA: hypothetical protein HPQ04_02075 [Rhodospirillaceae bacterium]|nr:hypothetical protein [Rhodospirillaceae bacterium]